MNDREDHRGFNLWRYATYALAGMFAINVTVALILALIGEPSTWLKNAASFGDMQGTANALFSGLALGGVAYGLHLQRRDFGLTKRSLENQVAELSRQRLGTHFFRRVELLEKTEARVGGAIDAVVNEAWTSQFDESKSAEWKAMINAKSLTGLVALVLGLMRDTGHADYSHALDCVLSQRMKSLMAIANAAEPTQFEGLDPVYMSYVSNAWRRPPHGEV